MDMKRLYFPVVKGQTIGNIASATITTNDLDRQGEIVEPDGISLTHYLANPVVLYGHNYGGIESIPVGRAVSMEIYHEGDKKSLKADWEWQADDVTPLISAVKKSWERGFLNTVSIGFMAAEYEDNVIAKSELLEFSICPIPANPQALRLNGFTDEEVKALAVEPTPADLIADLEALLPGMITKPEDTGGKYIRIRVRDPGDFQEGTLRTVTISAEQGILSVMGKLKGESTMTSQNFMFEKAKGWDLEKARAWIKAHDYTERALDRDLLQTCVDSLTALLKASGKSASGDAQPEPETWLEALHRALVKT